MDLDTELALDELRRDLALYSEELSTERSQRRYAIREIWDEFHEIRKILDEFHEIRKLIEEAKRT